MIQTFLYGIIGGALNLVPIIVEPNDLAASESGDLASGASNSTPDVEDPHTLA